MRREGVAQRNAKLAHPEFARALPAAPVTNTWE